MRNVRSLFRISTIIGGLGQRPEPLIGLILFAGIATTAVGVTVAANDTVVLAGIVLSGIGVVAMWLPGQGGLRLSTSTVIGAFVIGSALTGLAMTVNTSNALLFWGMVLVGLGIIGMWWIGKSGLLAWAVALVFTLGNCLQAAGLTLAPSNVLVLCGMVLVGASIIGMWVYDNQEEEPSPSP